MSTTFWLPSATTAAVSPTPSGVDWAHINTVSRVLNISRGTSALTDLVYTPDAGNDLVDANALFAQFVSTLLPPQTIPAQLIILGLKCLEALATNNLFLTWKLYAVNAAGDSVLGTLVAIRRDGTEVLITTSGKFDSVTSTEVVLASNFRLVLEVGLGGTPLVTGGHNGTINFGEVNISDILDTNSGTGSPSLKFNENLQFNALPVVGDVDNGVVYGNPNSPSTGTLVVPITNDVRDGVDYGAGGVEFDGDLVLPAEDDVVEGVGYGADGTEFEGNYETPEESQVEDGVTFGPNGSLTGTFEGSGGGTVVLIRR